MSLQVKAPTVHAVLKGMAAGGRGYGISHYWDGTVLTVTSDSGTSSADLAWYGGKPTVVTVTEQEDGSYAADMSFREIAAAVQAGTMVLSRSVLPNGMEFYGQLAIYTPELISFSTYIAYGDVNLSVFCHIAADESVTIGSAPNGEKDMPYTVQATKSGNTVTVTAAYSDFHDEKTVIELDDDGVPIRVTKDGESCSLWWGGFDA